MMKKPLGSKSYGSIPHLPDSRVGPGDYHIHEGQAKIATEKKRDKNDLIIVQEKLDGSNVGAAKINGEIIPITRAGYHVEDSNYFQHKIFGMWVKENEDIFQKTLNEGERLCGEWLAMAAGTRYNLPHEPFVAFDIIKGKTRVPFYEFNRRCLYFKTPHIISIGDPLSISDMMDRIIISGHGAIDPVEGAIWRVERNGVVDFLCKYVRHDKEDGKYFPEKSGLPEVWNINIEKYLTPQKTITT